MSFKIKITANSETKPEIRRFDHNPDGITLAILKKKLIELAPNLESHQIDLKWVDEDGDAIIIESDGELQSALKSMSGLPVFKIQAEASKLRKLPEQPEVIHEGVMCDNCQNIIKGFRYKCVICPDFDLCQTCEGNGENIHDEHNMIRIANPDKAWPKHFFKRVSRMHEKMVANQLARKKEKALAAKNNGTTSWLSFGTPAEETDTKEAQGQFNDEDLGTTEDFEKNVEDDVEEDEDEQSLEDVVQQLSTHGADYLRTLGTMIAEALDNFAPDEDAIEEQKKNEKATSPADQKEEELNKNNIESSDSQETKSSGSTMQDALEILKGMGFTDDGGWLSQLLETKNGNVEQTLDAIKPKSKAE